MEKEPSELISKEGRSDSGRQDCRESNTGIVYILTNPAMENYIKVGITRGESSEDVRRRMKELANHSGVPRAFDCEYAALVHNYDRVERALLYAFDHFRVNPRREFLEGIDPIRVKAVLKLHEIKDVTPRSVSEENVDPDEILEKPVRRAAFTFEMVKIPVGETLKWADDPDRIQCEVADDATKVRYDGKDYALSTSARDLKRWKRTPSGTRYWIYEEGTRSETLQERRDRLEGEQRVGRE